MNGIIAIAGPPPPVQAKLRDLQKAASEAGLQGLALPLTSVTTGDKGSGVLLPQVGCGDLRRLMHHRGLQGAEWPAPVLWIVG